MSGDSSNTTNHNIEVVYSVGFKKIGNTSIFKRDKDFLISPTVSAGTTGNYWFDIRKVNIDKLQEK